AHVRSFGPAKGRPGPEKQPGPTSPSDFEEKLRRLQEEMDELRRQYRKLPEGSADKERSEPSPLPPRSAPLKPSAPPAAAAPADRALFRQDCANCHRADGTGSRVRRRHPGIPDFTDASWQAGRSDGQLRASILDGKGKEMPSFRGKVSDEQAR